MGSRDVPPKTGRLSVGTAAHAGRRFAVVVGSEPTDDQLRALRRRCADVVIDRQEPAGRVRLFFHRRAPSLVDAIVSAVRDLDSVGLSAVHVLDDEHHVTLADVARRTGRSHQVVRRWARARSGPGGFPPPLFTGTKGALYSWSEVSSWLREHLGLEVDSTEAVFTAVNLALQLRALAPRIERMAALRTLIAG
jgi:hypothetical protein